jgi:hypothetical protein
MTGLPESMPVTVEDRRWLRGTKAWRVTLAIPCSHDIPVMLTALIERQVAVTIAGTVSATINPACIVDVSPRKGKFLLLVETCFDHQSTIGPRLTELIGQTCSLRISPIDAPSKEPKAPTIDAKQIAALHHSFFVNPKFQAYIRVRTGVPVEGCSASTKTTTKAYLGVKSTKDIRPEQFSAMLSDFNGWVNAPHV